MKCRVLESGMCAITYSYKKGIHDGIDIVNVNSNGTHILGNITAHSEGVVVSCRKDYKKTLEKTGGSYGNYVKIRHNNGYYTLYAHMGYNTVKVKVGDSVKKNQVLGYMGATGMATGGYLHFEVRNVNDIKIDPTNYLNNDLPSDKFEKGKDYITLDNMYVRWGAGTNYGVKLVKNLTNDGKNNALNKNPNDYAIYKKGTIYTAIDIIKNGYGVWAKTPSGYVCMQGASGRDYAKRK